MVVDIIIIVLGAHLPTCIQMRRYERFRRTFGGFECDYPDYPVSAPSSNPHISASGTAVTLRTSSWSPPWFSIR